ncbi:MAG: type IV secretory system conjugative DNA transfer family protein [Solirubrobacteraceae bacterium]
MSSTSRGSAGPSNHAETVALWGGLGALAIVCGSVSIAVHLGAALDRTHPRVPGNPVALVLGLVKGTVRWPASAGIVLLAAIVLLTAIAALAGVVVVRVRGRGSRVDRAARWMGGGRDLARFAHKQAAGTAQRLGVQQPGLALARTVAGGRTLYAGWEDVIVLIAGPRTGKTVAHAIPLVLDAPGGVFATSNKRDLIDATRGPRADAGEVWVFDPQAIAGEEPSWWWNPLSYVTDEVKAARLADVFALSGRDPGARTDAFFDPAGQSLVANLLLAAALAGRSLTQVYLWLTRPNDDEAVGILEEHGLEELAASLQAVINAPEKQRGGIYGTAQQMCSFLTNRAAMRWVTAGDVGARRELDPREFVKGTSTLYSLSKEGKGSCGALVAGLTIAVTEAAEDLAKLSQHGRLPVPLVGVLDEAANVCRWRELPDLYSHYGSRGIVLSTILQSFSQGVEVWGKTGMSKLWSAATVKMYGGGVSEVEFLEQLSRLIGDFDLQTSSISHSQGRNGGRSTSRSVRRERILDVADLSALPKGRVIVLGSGARPTLARTLPWMDGPRSSAVRESIARHDPGATPSTRGKGQRR